MSHTLVSTPFRAGLQSGIRRRFRFANADYVYLGKPPADLSIAPNSPSGGGFTYWRGLSSSRGEGDSDGPLSS